MDDQIFNKEPLSSSKAAAEDKCTVSHTYCQNDLAGHPLSNCNNDMDYKVKIKDEFLCQDSASFRVASESKGSTVQDIESQLGVSHFYSESQESKINKMIQGSDNAVDIKMEIKEELLYNLLTIVKSESSDSAIQDIDLQQRLTSVSRDSEGSQKCTMIIREDDNDMVTKIEIKEEPLYVNNLLTKVKSESDDSALSDKITTVFPDSEESEKCSVIQKVDNETEIKEEHWWLERTSTEIKCERYPSSTSDIDLQSVVKDSVTCMAGISTTEASRLHTEESLRDINVTRFLMGSRLKRLTKEATSCETHYTYVAYDKYDSEKKLSTTSHLQPQQLSRKCKRQYKSNLCEKSLLRKSDLKRHQLLHVRTRPDKCNGCENSFIQKSDLKQHQLLHEGTRPYKCNGCEKRFTKTSNLIRHQLLHEGIRPYKCNACEKSFTQSSNLKKHQLIHEGTRSHTCSVCDKTFTLKETLKKHQLIHEGIRPYKCNDCEKSFTQASHLKRHALTHEGKRPYKCNGCEKSYSRASYLKQHELIHQGTRP